MSFRPLTDADCGQPSALVRLASHITHDHALAESHGQVFPTSSDQLVEQFLEETRAVPQTFRMDDLMREMQEIESQRSAIPPVPASKVKDQINNDAWALQYLEDGKSFADHTNNEAIWTEISSREEELKSLGSAEWANEFFDDPQQKPAEVVKPDPVDDNQFQYSKFMKFMQQVGDGEISLEQGISEHEAQNWGKEFLSAAAKEDGEVLAQNWAKEHAASTADDSFNANFWDNLQDEWKKLSESENAAEHPWLSDFSQFVDNSYKEYTFTEENPMFDVQNPLERGKELLEAGDFPSAVLCFEAAVKKEPENVEAWLLLGTTQAENEQDQNAICALKRCLELDQSNLKALMALAASYTNESYHHQACQALVNWLKFNGKYSDLVPPDFQLTGQVTSLIDVGQHKIVEEMYIKAAQRQPLDVDYEVQCGLGILFNLSGEYGKATDCFRSALSVKPNDARLWNRLGATLANGSSPEDAVEAYHHALNICPGYIRARYNVGITCINLNAYKEAAEHFLTALNQQAKGKDDLNSGRMSQMSETIWSTLRMCISLMNRQDLRSAVDSKDLHTLNQAFDIVDDVN